MEEQQIVQIHSKKGRHRKKNLYNAIVNQMEFYFSDSNLTKDRFLSKLTQEDPYVDLSIFLKFNKIRNLTTSIDEICKALKMSQLLELSEDKLKVRRKTQVRCKENEDDCTIYVECLPADTEHDWLKDIFSKFGTVDYVSIPRYKHNKIIKGFAFIEFSSPESAQKVLECFESIGCKLPTTMPPEQLISITTFHDGSEKNDTTKTIKAENDNEERQDAETSESKKETSENKVSEESSKKQAINEEYVDKDESKGGTKRKKHSSSDESEEHVMTSKREKIEDVEEKEEETEKMENEENADADEEGPEDETNQGSEKTEKKKRKRKKTHKNYSNFLKQLGLKVLAKREWKQLRNKYLNLQRQKMKSLKEQLSRSRFSATIQNVDNSEKENPEKVTEPRFKYTPGTIVHFQLPEPCVDIKKFKAEMRSQSGVEYIDISVGSDTGYIRFSNSETAKEFSESSFNATKEMLEGQKEKDYWDRIIKSRDVKLKKEAGQKQRGRDKLLRKAEKELGKHIKFENNE